MFCLVSINVQKFEFNPVKFAIAGPIPFIVVLDIFRQEPRAAAMSCSLGFNWICNFILILTFRFIQVSSYSEVHFLDRFIYRRPLLIGEIPPEVY